MRLPSVTTILASATKNQQLFKRHGKIKLDMKQTQNESRIISSKRGTAMHKFLESHILKELGTMILRQSDARGEAHGRKNY